MADRKNFDALSSADQLKVMAALDVLCSEADIANKLTKLAILKTTKPLIWKMALAKLTGV